MADIEKAPPLEPTDPLLGLAEAQGQDVVGAEGQVDAGEGVAERQAGQHQAPSPAGRQA